MSLQPLLINGKFRAAANPTGSYQSTNPMTGEKLPWSYPYSEWDDIEAVLQAAADAVSELRQAPRQLLAGFSRNLRRTHRSAGRRARRSGPPRDRPARAHTPDCHRASPHHRPAAPGRGSRTHAFLDPGHHRHRRQHSLLLRPPPGSRRCFRAEQLSLCLQWRRRR